MTIDFRVLEREFFERHTVDVAKDLVGKLLGVSSSARDISRKSIVWSRIVEVEAYRAKDPASHCSKGLTPRCEPMFEAPGRAYVYLIYGMYEMLNFVTERKGDPGAVLIRGIDLLQECSPSLKTNGPGKLSKALGIQMKDNRESLNGPRLWVAEDDFTVPRIKKSKRVGIKKGLDKNWRFFLPNCSGVSSVPENKGAKWL